MPGSFKDAYGFEGLVDLILVNLILLFLLMQTFLEIGKVEDMTQNMSTIEYQTGKWKRKNVKTYPV